MSDRVNVITAGLLVLALALTIGPIAQAQNPLVVSVDWTKEVGVSKTHATMQVIPNARARRGQPLHEVTYSAIKDLDAKYVRYLLWGPYPRLQIAALEAPTSKGTSWNFEHIDPELIDFLEATKGREPVVNFSSVPPWMLTRSKSSSYPKKLDEMDWGCVDGSFDPAHWQLRDPTGKELGDYYARIVSWYTRGGFTDENGRYHHSGHKYDLPWWGVLNEFTFLGPERYTIIYDAIVSAIRKVSPTTRFVSIEMAGMAFTGTPDPKFFEYFLNPKNHQPGIQVDMIGFHFYAIPAKSQDMEHWQYTFFDQTDALFTQIEFTESIRKRLSPDALVYLDELGSILPGDLATCSSKSAPAIPSLYWNLSAAHYAYLYAELTKRGISAAAQAGFSFYPGNFASVSMVDWNLGDLNARFHALKLIRRSFGPGDRLMLTKVGSSISAQEDVYAQAFTTPAARKLLIVNKRSRAVEIQLNTLGKVHSVDVVDEESAKKGIRAEALDGQHLQLNPFAVVVVSFQHEPSDDHS